MIESDYGQGGLLGMLTPQANTTVEPEFWSLLPAEWSMVNARLISSAKTIEERLVEYTTRFVETARIEFSNAPIDVIGIGCTGASYLIARETEDRLMDEISKVHGVPCYTAAAAMVLALNALSAKRIALLSPYPDTLNVRCVPYWESFGFDIVAVKGPALETSKFHPIYGMTGVATNASLKDLQRYDVDAVAMLGTGMPTLMAIANYERAETPVPISCNLALAWACIESKRGRPLDRTTLMEWVRGQEWIERFRSMFPKAAGTS